MGFFWLVFAIGVVCAVAGTLLFVFGLRAYLRTRTNRLSYEKEGAFRANGGGFLIVVALFIWFTLAGYAVDRHYSELRCEKKNELTADRYVWVDYHFFGYECLLRTPSGNITETPVLPLEDVTDR